MASEFRLPVNRPTPRPLFREAKSRKQNLTQADSEGNESSLRSLARFRQNGQCEAITSRGRNQKRFKRHVSLLGLVAIEVLRAAWLGHPTVSVRIDQREDPMAQSNKLRLIEPSGGASSTDLLINTGTPTFEGGRSQAPRLNSLSTWNR